MIIRASQGEGGGMRTVHHPTSVAREVEWLLLLLGLPGIVAILLPFGYRISPWQAVTMMGGFTLRPFHLGNVAWYWLHAPYFFAPLLSVVQFARCVGRPLLAWHLEVLRMLVVPQIVIVLFLLADEVWLAMQPDYDPTAPEHLATFTVVGLTVANLVACRALATRGRDDAIECLVLGVYVASFAMWAVGVAGHWNLGAAVVGWTCAVYAVSYLRRVRGM